MSDRDRTDIDDIEFEFFDDPPTTEATQRVDEDTMAPARPSGPGRPPRGPRGPRPQIRVRRPGSNAPVLRLALLAAAVIVLVLLLVLGLRSCGGGKDERFGDYLEQVRAISAESQKIGERTLRALVARDLPSAIQQTLLGLSEQEKQLTAQAAELDVPQELASEHEALVQALDFRTKGLTGLSVAFSQLGRYDEEDRPRVLAQQASRLIASDVVYQDLFLTPTAQVLKDAGVDGIEVPGSRFVTDAETYSESSFEFLVQNFGVVEEGDEAAGLHGTSLVGVRALPADVQLAAGVDNRLDANANLAFEVDVQNSGDFLETEVQVRLTVQQGGGQQEQLTRTISVINPDDVQSVRFDDLADLITLAAPVLVKVAVLPVEGEELFDNNTGDYTVILSFEN